MATDTRRPDRKFVQRGKQILRDLATRRAPVTYTLIGCVLGIFLVEIWVSHARSLNGVETVTSGLFVLSPVVGWGLSPVLHGGVVHVSVNVLGLVLLGIPLERHWSRTRYLLFVIGTGYAATITGGIELFVFAGDRIASYGVSGVTYGLAGFSFVHLPCRHWPFDATQGLVLVFAASSLIAILSDVATGPYLTQEWLNTGHLVGFSIGILAGVFEWNRASS